MGSYIPLVQFLVSFVYVFMKGFQHQNVIGGNYKSAFWLCWCMAALEVATVSLIVSQGQRYHTLLEAIGLTATRGHQEVQLHLGHGKVVRGDPGDLEHASRPDHLQVACGPGDAYHR